MLQRTPHSDVNKSSNNSNSNSNSSYSAKSNSARSNANNHNSVNNRHSRCRGRRDNNRCPPCQVVQRMPHSDVNKSSNSSNSYSASSSRNRSAVSNSNSNSSNSSYSASSSNQVGPNEALAAVLGSRLVRAEKTDARICSISCRSRQPVGLGELEVRVWVLTPGKRSRSKIPELRISGRGHVRTAPWQELSDR